jgi:hypothetical protein
MVDAVRALEMLKSQDSAKRYEACEELRVAPTLARESIDALKRALSDPSPEVADAAGRALAIHSPSDAAPAFTVPSATQTTAGDPSNDPFLAELNKIKHERQRARAAEAAAAVKPEPLVAEWDDTILTLLGETASAMWGSDAYTLISPDGIRSLTWTAIRQQGKQPSRFAVTLVAPSHPPAAQLDTPSHELRFVVAGDQQVECQPTIEALKRALIEVFASGPSTSPPDEYTAVQLSQSPYVIGEHEAQDWKLVIFPIISVFVGLAIMGSNDPAAFLFGLVIIAAAIASLSVTQTGKRFSRLPASMKLLALVGAVPGVCGGGFAILAIAALLLWLGGAAQREKSVSEIEEGVRRALNR